MKVQVKLNKENKMEYKKNGLWIEKNDSFENRESFENYLSSAWDWSGEKKSKNIYVIICERS